MSTASARSAYFVAATVEILLPNRILAADDALRLPTVGTVGGSEIVSLGASLAIVILAIIAVGWLYSRMQRVGHRTGDVIDIVASRSLGPKERILLIEIAEKQLLIGMTASQVQTLHVFDQPVALAKAPIPTSGFAQRLRSSIREITK